jgi:hypothetical protein
MLINGACNSVTFVGFLGILDAVRACARMRFLVRLQTRQSLKLPLKQQRTSRGGLESTTERLRSPATVFNWA